MPSRVASPSLSENEVDISNALLAYESDSESASDSAPSKALKHHPQRLPLLDLEDGTATASSDDDGFIAMTQMDQNRKSSNIKGRSVKKGGGFQAMGLNAALLKAIARKGFSVPTPIQRKTIPLVLAGQDVVGMARTGSGKTAAFVVPMLEKLKAHSAKVGARALIMSPSRELALQTLKVVKELGKGTDLKCVLLVGGDSLEEQFGLLAGNPDIIIATPGRFLHLKVEMGLDLFSIRYVVFDEADRLFEMGFAAQLAEILHALPTGRQTLLFSATLPSSLVEFARAGLQDPSLVRLDAESKVSPDLQSAFFSVKSAEKEGALLHVIAEVIKIPTGLTEAAKKAKENVAKVGQKRKRDEGEKSNPNESPTAHSTLIFTATKHHVEYIASLLRRSGYAVSHVYGSLDQTARKMQVQDFRSGMTNILVVTDVAARGIDIPILANVINYDFPAQPKIFVHRVGRTARAGQRGWSYSFARDADLPYLLDLQLFLGKRLVLGRSDGDNINCVEDVVVGSLPRDRVEESCESITKLLEEDADLTALRLVAAKGEKLYMRTRNSASSESAKRAKEMTASKQWTELHPLFKDNTNLAELEREEMLARVSGFRPPETIFEVGKRGAQGEAGEVVKRRRGLIEAKKRRARVLAAGNQSDMSDEDGGGDPKVYPAAKGFREQDSEVDSPAMSNASDSELEITLTNTETNALSTSKSASRATKKTLRDPQIYMSYAPTTINAAEDRAYGVHSGGTNSSTADFLSAARSAAMDLANDEGAKSFGEPSRASGMRWDKKQKKYVARANDEDGSKKGSTRLVRSESGGKIAASFRSGRFDAWRKANRVQRLPRVGEAEVKGGILPGGGGSSGIEGAGGGDGGVGGGRRWKHKQDKAPKPADKARDDFHKRKKQVEAAKERRAGPQFRDGAGRNEVKSAREVLKGRAVKAKKREKTGRPARKGKGKGKGR